MAVPCNVAVQVVAALKDLARYRAQLPPAHRPLFDKALGDALRGILDPQPPAKPRPNRRRRPPPTPDNSPQTRDPVLPDSAPQPGAVPTNNAEV